MAEFERIKKEDDKSSQPHPHAVENYNFTLRQLGNAVVTGSKIEWNGELIDPVRWEISDMTEELIFNPLEGKYDRIKRLVEPKNITFVFYKRNSMQTTHLSFHVPSRSDGKVSGFKEQLCNILNTFGALGLMQHKTRNSDGSSRKGSPAQISAQMRSQSEIWDHFSPRKV